MDLTLVLLTSASHIHINSDKAASGKRSKPLPRIVVALLQSIFNTVARRSYSHPSQTSTTTPSQSSRAFLPHSRWKSQLSPLLAMSYTVCTLLWSYHSPIFILIHSPVAELPLLQHARNTSISGPLTCYFLCFSPESVSLISVKSLFKCSLTEAFSDHLTEICNTASLLYYPPGYLSLLNILCICLNYFVYCLFPLNSVCSMTRA